VEIQLLAFELEPGDSAENVRQLGVQQQRVQPAPITATWRYSKPSSSETIAITATACNSQELEI